MSTNSTAVATTGPVTLQAILGDPAADWQRPAVVPAPVAKAAAAALAAWQERYAMPSQSEKLDFLVNLGLLVAGNFTEADARAKAEAMADALNHPACCFSKRGALPRIAAQFKFWPSFAELKAALDAELHRQKTLEARLRALLRPAVAAPTKPPGKRWDDLTDEERAEHERLMAELRSAPGPKPEQGETARSRATREAIGRVAQAMAAKPQQQPEPTP